MISRKYFFTFFLSLLIVMTPSAFAESGVKASIALSPAGSFEVKAVRIRGNATKNADGSLSAAQLRVSVDSLETGIVLRDQHLHEKLKVKKHPNIIISNAKGVGGKGTAQLELGGIKKNIPFQFSEKGKLAEVSFQFSLKEFSIGGINYMGVGVQDNVQVKAYVPIR